LRWLARGDDVEEELLVDLVALALGGGGEQFGGEVGEDAEVADGVIGEHRQQRGCDEACVAGGAHAVFEAGDEGVAAGMLERQAQADAAAEGQQVVAAQQVGEAAIAGEDDAEQGLRVELGGGEQAQLGERGSSGFRVGGMSWRIAGTPAQSRRYAPPSLRYGLR
jgi:hypothetical protein